ncbi:cupin domain-containing protein [Streptomyces sp. NPDC002588]|uniref:cupin domain-containing protein n=1 Tax=Streptomyces sp. NPDC002588 TaxID=3154419 RepID=UPI00331F79BF
MTGEHKQTRARRIMIGLDDRGRSTIVEDGPTRTRLATEAYTLNQIWQATTVPTPVSAENTLGPKAVIPPPPNGYTFVVATFPPDSEWDYEEGWAKALADSGAGESLDSAGGIPGLHATETIDLVTIVSGEIYAITETGETLMRPGDSLVQRGTKHAWSNRGHVPCTLAAVHIAAVR